MAESVDRPLRVCFFGDSFVLGTGDREGLGWVGRVCARARARGRDVTAYNLGIRGDTSGDVLGRFQSELNVRLRAGDDMRLVFSFGANDCASVLGVEEGRVALPRLLANTERILREASARYPTLMLGPLPVSDDGEADARIAVASAALSTLCGELRVPYLSLLEVAQASPVFAREAAAVDGTHPGGGGYAALADVIEAWGPLRAWLGG